jgi:hypothetical protein
VTGGGIQVSRYYSIFLIDYFQPRKYKFNDWWPRKVMICVILNQYLFLS